MGLSIRSITAEESASLALRYQQVRQTTLSLCAPLSAEDMQFATDGRRQSRQVAPGAYHVVFRTFILSSLPNHAAFHPEFTYLFNSYTNSWAAIP